MPVQRTGGWQLKMTGEGEGEVFRRYEFSDVPMPAVTTSLKISIRLFRNLSGVISPSLELELRPYLYLLPDRLPMAETGSIVSMPFCVELSAAFLALKDPPRWDGALFDVHGCAIEGDMETIVLGTSDRPVVMEVVQTISTGRELTFAIYEGRAEPDDRAEPSPVKLQQTKLANDQEFIPLYNELLRRCSNELTYIQARLAELGG
jgi:hypothetical protein